MEIKTNGLEFRIQYREYKGDEGFCMQVFTENIEALRFDLFEKSPHYHLDPNGPNATTRTLNHDDVPIPSRWALENIKGNLAQLLIDAGFSEVAATIDRAKIQTILPQITQALRRNPLVIATSNPGKIEEFKKILGNEHFVFESLKDIGFDQEIIEDGKTFAENALIKARTVFRACQKPILADDSGLQVSALNGAPGIYTARFAGENATDDDNINLLLQKLENQTDRSAQFYCALAYIDQEGNEQVFEGICPGQILTERKGSNGFGYDPVFLAEGQTKSFGQMEAAEKKALSHRGKAIQKFSDFLQQ